MDQESRPLIVYSCHRIQTAINVAAMLALRPVDIYSLGDDVYLEQVFGSTSVPFYGRYSDSVSAPAGSGARVQIGAPTGGALPTGAATVLAAGSGYPAGGPAGTLVGCTISAFFLPLAGLAQGQVPATGRVTTNASRQVASITVDFGGTGYTATAAAEYQLVSSCDPLFWLLKSQHQKADSGWQLLQSRRNAGEYRVFSQFDDHELVSNLTFASADLTSRNSAGAPWWESQTGQSALLNFWRTGSAGFDLIRQAWYDNPPPAPNSGGDIPAGLVGASGVTAADFPVRYHAQDYGAGMTPGGAVLRVIHLDTLSYTSPYNATDDGTGTSGKTKLGRTQVQWLLQQLRDAKARGMAAVVLSPKDLGNIDNGDSWRGTGGGATGYAGELAYILTAIETENLPVAAWIGGDRHQPHVAMFDTRNGSAGTLLSICPCPLGADPAGLTAYPENIWACRDPDAAVYGTIKLLGSNAVRLQIIDSHTGTEAFGADVLIGQRRPYAVRGATDSVGKELTEDRLTSREVPAVRALVSEGGNFAPLLSQAARRTSVLKRFSDQVGVAYANSGTAATVSIDSASPFGRPALKVALASGTTWAEVQLSGLTLGNFDDHIIWRVWVEDYTAIQQIGVFAGTTGYGRYSQQNYQFSTSNTHRYNGELDLAAGPLRQAVSGTFVHGTDTLSDTKIRITGGGSAANVWVDAVVVPARGTGIVLMTYDDGFRSWANYIAPDLLRNGLVGSFGFQSNLVGTNDTLYLNAVDIRALSAAGHELASHQVSNTRFNDGTGGTQTAAQYQADYRTSLAALRSIIGPAASCDYHPYVQGGHTQSLIDTLRAEGLRVARSVDNLGHNFHSAGLGRGIYSLKTHYMDQTAPDLATLMAAVDAAEKYGTTHVLMGHDFGPNAPGASYWTASLHAQLADYIGAKVRAGRLLNMTVGQYAAAVYSAGLVERQFRAEMAA